MNAQNTSSTSKCDHSGSAYSFPGTEGSCVFSLKVGPTESCLRIHLVMNYLESTTLHPAASWGWCWCGACGPRLARRVLQGSWLCQNLRYLDVCLRTSCMLKTGQISPSLPSDLCGHYVTYFVLRIEAEVLIPLPWVLSPFWVVASPAPRGSPHSATGMVIYMSICNLFIFGQCDDSDGHLAIAGTIVTTWPRFTKREWYLHFGDLPPLPSLFSVPCPTWQNLVARWCPV